MISFLWMRMILKNEVGEKEDEMNYYCDVADEDLDTIIECIFKEAEKVTPADILGIVHKAQMHALRGHSDTCRCKLSKDNLEHAVKNYFLKSKRKQAKISNRRIKIKK